MKYNWVHFILGLVAVAPLIIAEIYIIIADYLERRRRRNQTQKERDTPPKISIPEIKSGYIKDKDEDYKGRKL